MTRSTAGHIMAGALCAVVSIILATYTTDREFVNLAPSAGTQYQVPLVHGMSYEQHFVAQRYSITRLGIFLKVLDANIPDAAVLIQLYRGQQLIAEQSVHGVFIDSEGFTQVRLLPPVRTVPGEQLIFTLAVPPVLSGRIAALTRASDPSFNVRDVPLVISGSAQSSPLAHQAYFSYRPPLALQIGLLCLYAAVLLLFPRLKAWHYSPALHALVISTAAIIPALQYHSWPFLLHAAFFITLYGMYVSLRRSGTGTTAAWTGAYVAALTSWWTLHYLGGREKLLVLSLLPLVLYVARTWHELPRPRRWAATISLLLVMSVFIIAGDYQRGPWLEERALLKDIFLDPYQVVLSEKIVDSVLTWDHFGSYIGVIALFLASVGVVWRMKRSWVMAIVGIATLAAVQLTAHNVTTIIPFPYLVILLTFVLAYFSAWGLEGLRRYVGGDQVSARIAQVIAIIVLLDLLFVLATTLEASYLL